MKKYSYFISGSAPQLYPTESFFGNLMWSENDGVSVPYCCPFADEWGKPLSMHIYDKKKFPIPIYLDMIWLSLTENKFYSVEEELSAEALEQSFQEKDIITGESLYNYIIVGMAPYGHLALWVHGDKKSKIIAWLKAEEVDVKMSDFCPSTQLSRNEYVKMMLQSVPEAFKNKAKNGLPPRYLFDKYMQQFHYRYLFMFGHWDKNKDIWLKNIDEEIVPQFNYIEETLYDGTHDKLNDSGLMKYHQAGKPKKLRAQWHIGKSEYSAYFWFEDERIRDVFDKFYGTHPDTKTDFIIRIDAEQRKYELALYRYGLKEPQIIPEDVYQLLVFKNKFEDYRSENYNQERGAWIW